MKKLLALVAILALVAAMVVPMAVLAIPAGSPQTAAINVQGAMVGPTVALTGPPTGIDFGQFAPGWNPSPTTFKDSGTGDVILTQNSDLSASFTLTATSNTFLDGSGRMYCSTLGNYLTDPMQVTFNDGTGTGYLAGGATLSSSTTGHNYFTVGAAQQIVAADGAIGAGEYSITVTLTAQANY
jgi:hypothetical protein